MIRNAIVLVLSVLLLSATGCGGGGDAPDELEDDLPALVPTQQEVRAVFPELADDPLTVSSGYWPSNGTSDPLSDWPYNDLYAGTTGSDLSETGHVIGYQARYILGETDRIRPTHTTVEVVVNLYQDEESAEAEVDRLPNRAIRSPRELVLGDQAATWGYGVWTSPDGIEASWPVEFRFRVGRLVGYVEIGYPFPYAGASLPPWGTVFHPGKVALAEHMAERMRAALASS